MYARNPCEYQPRSVETATDGRFTPHPGALDCSSGHSVTYIRTDRLVHLGWESGWYDPLVRGREGRSATTALSAIREDELRVFTRVSGPVEPLSFYGAKWAPWSPFMSVHSLSCH
jgi:hypothetical protein